jgi:hypothetical protein
MLNLMPTNFRAVLVLLAGTVCWRTTAIAQSTPAPATAQPSSRAATESDTIRLTDEQRDAILDANGEARAAVAHGEPTGLESVDRGVHGEVGLMIGSNGARGVYGAADIPLSDNAGVSVSFENSRFGHRRRD